jgi:DNA-binding transcriptional ArsR family regulator/anti-sigma regulatory factor (Ser/Thr protein kinase)
MKSFFDAGSAGEQGRPSLGATRAGTVTVVPAHAGARIAIYDSLAVAPRVEEIDASDLGEAIEKVASRTYNLARERGGGVPYTIIREIAENLIHAGFSEVVVTILDEGNTVRFADQGPGIADKSRAFLPGFSTATADMKRHIKGVGSGLPIVKECLSFAGGTVEIDDNLGTGTVVTLRVAPKPKEVETSPNTGTPRVRLPDRQKQVLSLVMELGSAGPSVVARELAVGLSTAYRDLASLEDAGLIVADESGKRALTEHGVSLLDTILR